ncbi:hypothetical protein [Thiomicrorhabdus xiamenensis]|uniref:Uncharacterized protein n=1 Tax=Thiomicrorhabdus xiamenensis TaxID=2739063 RepID=A0A7D4SZW3_9GAMM|nr:hypothetical protein [Thiomicrorhabdus xiamenensis]QKI88822.1 hypothetical protein HQN79_04195 [Thiomicrorhabdus xiamenensis]
MTASFFFKLGRFIKYFGSLSVLGLFLFGVHTLITQDLMQGIALIALSAISAWSVSLLAGGCRLAAETYRYQLLSD